MGVRVLDREQEQSEFRALSSNSSRASVVLRSLANENRLTILCLLAEGEKSVGELEMLTGARQPSVSQQLARLRADGLVDSRRAGKTIFYRLDDDRTRRILEFLDELYCLPEDLYDPAETGARQGLRS